MTSKILWVLALLTALAIGLAPTKAKSETTSEVTRETPVATTTPAVPQTVEEYVRQEFPDAPVMVAIARCESRFRQFDSTGVVLKNPTSSARGVFQVMTSIHAAYAKAKLGLDVYTLEGNVGYARYLYERNGTRDWNASKACWG